VAKVEPSKTKVQQEFNYHKAVELATKRGITVAEFWRRDRAVKSMMSTCTLAVGKTYRPKDDKDFATYGNCEIKEICWNYFQCSDHDKWPEDDEPFTITFTAEKTPTKVILAVPWWFSPVPVKTATC
jgi:hypothetical protein